MATGEPPKYLIERWRTQLEQLFEEADREDVLDWLIANHDRKRVLLVGSGFSRNALNPTRQDIPLWHDVSTALAGDLRVDADTFDPLFLADFYRRNLGLNAFQEKLLNLLDDGALEAGDAHAALWRSLPEAVITTNFLDTLLERDPRAQPVIKDPDLAIDPGPAKAQLIYLHGHRSDFDSWVVGRSDYDDLPDNRPMLFARTRQLFAQFPLLVVGYSLTDPDFHLVYRQMVRAMNRRHPLGLAVVLPQDKDDSDQAQRAARKYWEDLGLRIVRFRKPDVLAEHQDFWSPVFVRFFELSKRLETRKHIESSYHNAADEGDMVEAFEFNVEVMLSAFEDPSLDRIWVRGGEQRSLFWLAALERALPEPLSKASEESARQFNLEVFHPSRSKDGSATHQHQPAKLLEVSVWASSSAREDPRFAKIWSLLQQQRGHRLVWQLERLLQQGVERPRLLQWLRLAVERPDILDEPRVQSVTVLCSLLMLSSWKSSDVQLAKERSSTRFRALAELLGSQDMSARVDPPLVRLLKQARRHHEMGEVAEAHRMYAEARENAPACLEMDAPLLEYFAVRGYADTLETPNYSSHEFEQLRSAEERATDAREGTYVRQWWDRVERLKNSLTESRVKQLEDEIAQGQYESTSVSFSNAAWHVDVLRQDAVNRGAPLSVEKSLMKCLLSSHDSDVSELEERLRLGIGKTGVWLSRRVRSGDLFRSRAQRPFEPDQRQATVKDRVDGTKKIATLLFPADGQRTEPHRAAVLDVLKEAPQVLLQENIVQAVDAIAHEKARKNGGPIGEELASVAGVCGWSDVQVLLFNDNDRTDVVDLQRTAQKFPWEHWILCDDFLHHGGDLFLDLLLEPSSEYERVAVGWALIAMLSVAPGEQSLLDRCLRFISQLIAEPEVNGSARDQLAHFAVFSTVIAEDARVVRSLMDCVRANDRNVMNTLAKSPFDTTLRKESRNALSHLYAAPNQEVSSVEDVLFLREFGGSEVLVRWSVLRERFTKSWRELPGLGPILNFEYWSPMDWRELQSLLQVGGHRGKPGSWLIARLNLVLAALRNESSRPLLFDDSPDGLGFLRHVVIDALGSGDGILANHAAYGLASLGVHVRSDQDAQSIAIALQAAADDVRINVTHGAAFAANFLVEQAGQREIHQEIREAAERVTESLAADPLAVVQRQAQFGVVKGRQPLAQLEREEIDF